MKREQTEWCQFYWYDTPLKDLPRILLVGDSIVVGYGWLVAGLLKGRAAVSFYATSKIVGDPTMYREVALALADYPVDMIYFNNGLHGLDCGDDLYRRGLEDFTDYLQLTTKARLFWRNSTPVTVQGKPDEFDPRNRIVLRRNEIAEKIMLARGIPVDNLYGVIVERAEFSAGDSFHYNKKGNAFLAEHVAAYLSEVLPRCERTEGITDGQT